MDEAQALDRLTRILDRPEFAFADRPFWERWWAALRDWLYDALWRLTTPVGEAATGRRGWLELLVLLVSLVLLAALVYFLVRAAGMAVLRESRQAAGGPARSRARSDQLWLQAQDLAAAGDFAGAARAVYLSALYALEEHGVLRVQESRTNREHAALIRGAHAALSEVFGLLVARYDRLRFGNIPVDRGAFDDLRTLAGRARAMEA